ncbi:MAG: hypothetical protein R3D29_10785 [Nitratireductor sp.]
MSAYRRAAANLETLSAKLDGSIAGIENIVKSVDPTRCAARSTAEFTSQLKGSGSDVKELVASAKTAMVDLKAFSASINTSLASVDKLLAAADAEKIGKIVDNVSEASENAKSVIANANSVTDAFARRRKTLMRLSPIPRNWSRLNKASGKVDSVLTGLDGLLSRVTARV